MNIKFVLALIALSAAVGCASTAKKASSGYNTGATYAEDDPNPYANYENVMVPDAAHPMAVEWQNANEKAIESAVELESLKRLALDASAASALLAEVKRDYATDPIVSTRIAAVSQLVLCRKWTEAPKARDVWTEALLVAAEKAPDAYRKLFFLDQLRWCAKADQAERIRALGAASGDRHVVEFANVVAKDAR